MAGLNGLHSTTIEVLIVVLTEGLSANATTTVNSKVLPAGNARESIFNAYFAKVSLKPALFSTLYFAASQLSPWVHLTDQAKVRAELEEHDAACERERTGSE